MPVSSIEDIWAVICDECKKTVTEFAFDCFFVKLKPVSISGGEFCISSTDEYALSIIEQNYFDLITKCTKTVMGNEFEVKLVFDDEEEKIKKAEQFSAGLSFEDFFSFDNFIVGSTNRFAHAASYAVADNPNLIYNPLIIYGPSGVGKTHLMLAIKNHIRKKFPMKKI